MKTLTLRATPPAGMLILLALSVGAGCSTPGSTQTPDGGEEGGAPDGSVPCAPGTQDENGDGQCQPDCAATACVNGICSIAAGTGLAVCSCSAGFQGPACDQLLAPSASEVAFWVDAADASSIALHPGSSAVASWADKGTQSLSGTSVSAVAAPVVLANAQNGRTVLRFDGIDDHLTFPGFTGFTNAEYTLFLVMRSLGTSSGTVYQGKGTLSDSVEGSASPTNVHHYHEPSGGQSSVSADKARYGDDGWSPDQFHLLTFRVRSEDLAVWVDGRHMQAEPTASAAKLTETVSLILGARENGGNGSNCEVAELIVVSKALHHGERRPYEDYLAAKWFGAAFPRTPSSFGVNLIWLDASQGKTLATANGAVTDWGNRGLYGGSFSNGAFPNARPQLVPAALNGKPVVRFDGGDALVQNGLTLPPGGEASQYTMVAVVVPPSQMALSSQYLFRANKASNDANVFELMLAPNALPNGQVVFHHRWPAGNPGFDSINAEANFTKPLLIKVERSSSASFHLIAGEASKSSSGDVAQNISSGEIFNWFLGGESISAPGSSALHGDLAELIVLTGDLGNAEETALLGALRAKWGL